MNERIQTLLAKFKETESTHRGDAVLIGFDEIEKFAELIVRECMDVVLDKDGKEWAGYVHVCREESAGMIKKHFGVEE